MNLYTCDDDRKENKMMLHVFAEGKENLCNCI